MWLVFALMSAVFFGIRGILYHWTSQRPMNRNLMLLGTFFSGAVISLFFSLVLDQSWTFGVWVGVLMGIFSFTANSSLYKAFSVGKASLIAILLGLPPVVVVILTYFLWNETLSHWQLFAFVVILIGITMIRYSNDLSIKRLQGAQWGLLAVLFFGLNDTSSKLSIRLEADIFPTLVMMFTTGSLCFFLFWWFDQRKASRQTAGAIGNKAVPLGWTARKTFLWGMVVGIFNVSGMMLILPAYKSGVTGLVSAVVAVNVLFILLYTRIVTKEKFSLLELSGILSSILGILILQLMK